MASGDVPIDAEMMHLQRLQQAKERIEKIVYRTQYIMKLNRLVPGAINEHNVKRWMPPEDAASSSFVMQPFGYRRQ